MTRPLPLKSLGRCHRGRAGVKGDRRLALEAMLVDEMAIVPEKAEAMLDELLESSRELLPQFRAATTAAR